MRKLGSVCFLSFFSTTWAGEESSTPSFVNEKSFLESTSQKECSSWLKRLPKGAENVNEDEICKQVLHLDPCKSVQGHFIYHFDYASFSSDAKKILVFGVTHGDEAESGTIAKAWMDRLSKIQSRSHWRIVPVLNPDGMLLNTRMNAKGVDLNRNYPTKDWEEVALSMWEQKYKKDPRRNPGISGGSEPETKCSIAHIEDYKPDFIIAIHTPYGVLDFDGPAVSLPQYSGLPWVGLGTFPGSLGRYMWHDRKVPVLTVELKSSKDLENLDNVYNLQDIVGTVALRAIEKLGSSSKK